MSIRIEEQLEKEGFFVSTTSGYSMYPMLRDRRDRVVLRALAKGERLKRGDLPLYRTKDGKYVLHRVLAKHGDVYVTRGDNTYFKEYVPREQMLGVVTEFYRGEKHIRVQQLGYRFYSFLWMAIYPLRLVWHQGLRLLSAIKRKLFKKRRS